jgi:diadenosine tetraphosphatase ApaH/serine/threonine PP2A family protein phosphatase
MALLDKGCLAALNPFARKALAVTRDRLSTRAKKYISTFKPFILRYGCRFVHGVPPDSFSGYLFKMPDHGLIRIMEGIYQRITFSGHTHQLKIYELYQGNLGRKTFVKLTVLLAKTRRYIINCGSVGQPRDCCNKAKYIIWDSTANTVTPRFVSYDYHRAANKIRQAGIPEIYADQLENPIF